MRPTRASGRPGTTVIPAGWETSHAGPIATTFDCTVQIGTPGGTPVWNPGTQQTETPAVTPVYDGPASVSVVTDTARMVDTAGDQVPLRRYEVALPHAVEGITTEHVVHVTVSPDPLLQGRILTDLAIERGRRFARVLLATLND